MHFREVTYRNVREGGLEEERESEQEREQVRERERGDRDRKIELALKSLVSY